MIKIGVYTINREGYTSFYRTLGPLLKIEKGYKNIQLIHFKAPCYEWSQLMNLDIMFMHLPNSIESTDFVLFCKSVGIKVWVDYDDNLFEMNDDHVSKNAIHKRRKIIEKILQYSDVVTVSTKYLRDIYAPYNKNILIIPNAMDLDLFKQDPIPGHHNFVTWRGGEGHADDLLSIQKPLEKVANKHDNWVFNFMGYDPVFMNIEKKVHYPTAPLFAYLNHLHTLASKIHIVPLRDNPYNRAKSNIAWMEATFSGSVVIAPNIETFQKPGIINYSSEEEFETRLEEAIKMLDKMRLTKLGGWDYIKSNLSLSEVNKLRLEVINSLMN